jgi:hypothetical protein
VLNAADGYPASELKYGTKATLSLLPWIERVA